MFPNTYINIFFYILNIMKNIKRKVKVLSETLRKKINEIDKKNTKTRKEINL